VTRVRFQLFPRSGGARTPGMNKPLLPALALLIALALPGCGYNRIQGLDEDVKGAWSEVQNQYQRRADLIPNLVNTVKGAAKFEQETLEKVIQARASATQVNLDASKLSDPAAFKRFQDAQDGLTSALGRLMVVAEKYPDLQATQAFRDLSVDLAGTENRIAVARKRYIDVVAEYNKSVRFFPTNLTAKFLLNAQPRETFAAAAGSDKPPEVKF